MKKITTINIIILMIFLSSCTSHKGNYEALAVEHLDKMSETIGGLRSCSYTLNTEYNKFNESNDMIPSFNEHDVYMKGPDKFYIYSTGNKGRNGYWYNGQQFSYYSYDRNEYDTVLTRGNILEAIDYLHHKFQIKFPAADFFYPTLTDDLIENFDAISLLQNEMIENKEYVVVLVENDIQKVEIWVDNESNLPFMLVMDPIEKYDRTYKAIFSNWKVNPDLPKSLFKFSPTASATYQSLESNK